MDYSVDMDLQTEEEVGTQEWYREVLVESLQGTPRLVRSTRLYNILLETV